MTENVPILELIEKLQNLDGPSRFILLTLIHSLSDCNYDTPITLRHIDLHRITGISSGKIAKIIITLLHEGYLIKMQDKLYLNGFKLQSVKQGRYVPQRTPYRRKAA